MPRARPVTLQDIARRAGVSKMTVSLALRGHPHAAAATRDRLRGLAQEMGYRPNPLIAANMAELRAGRRTSFAGPLAFAGLGASPARISAPNTQGTRIFLGAQRRAEALGYRLEWFQLDAAKLDGQRLSGIIRARGIPGVVLGANCMLEPRTYLDWARFALAAIGRTEVGLELHRTVGDYYRAVPALPRARLPADRARRHARARPRASKPAPLRLPRRPGGMAPPRPRAAAGGGALGARAVPRLGPPAPARGRHRQLR